MKDLFKNKRGQNTVEYLLMLAVIVGLVLVLGRMFKGRIGGVFDNVMNSVNSATGSLSSGGGNTDN